MTLKTLKLGVFAIGLLAFSQVNAQEKKQPDPEKMFASFDANNDKMITLDEFKSKKRKNEVQPEQLEKRYAAMDENSDGSVTLEEFKSSLGKAKGGKKKQN